MANKRKFLDAEGGTPDGMRCDVDGNIWFGWGMGSPELDGVLIYNADARLIGAPWPFTWRQRGPISERPGM